MAPALSPKMVTLYHKVRKPFPDQTNSAKDLYLRRIAPKGMYICPYPLQCKQLVLQPEVESATGSSFLSLRETEGPQPVVEADVHDRRAL